MNKAMLTAHVAYLKALLEEVKQANLTPPGVETLTELIDAETNANIKEWKYVQLEAVIKILFPTYSLSLPESEKPPRWPAKQSWWNGAHITTVADANDGGFIVNLTSYVGGGHNDVLEGLVVPYHWLEAEDKTQVLHSLIAKITDTKQVVDKLESIAKAERDLQSAKNHLAYCRGEK